MGEEKLKIHNVSNMYGTIEIYITIILFILNIGNVINISWFNVVLPFIVVCIIKAILLLLVYLKSRHNKTYSREYIFSKCDDINNIFIIDFWQLLFVTFFILYIYNIYRNYMLILIICIANLISLIAKSFKK